MSIEPVNHWFKNQWFWKKYGKASTKRLKNEK
jgi:hypothetical protein